MKPRVLDLFAGIGGFSLGLQRAGFKVSGQCEIEPFCLAVLAKHWPNVWRHNDVRTLTGDLVREHCGRIDLVCGGFPCQDVSSAGRGAGIGGARSGLYRELIRIVREVRPAWVVIENVPALRGRGADAVLADLEAAEYDARALVVGAWAVGAPHKRDRVWIVGNAHSLRQQQQGGDQRERRGWVGDASEGLGEPSRNRRGLGKSRREPEERIIAGGPSEGGMAHAERGAGRRQGRARHEELQPHGPEAGRQENDGGSENGYAESVADSHGSRCGNGQDDGARTAKSEFGGGDVADHCHAWPSRPGEVQHPWEAKRLLELPLGGVVDGLSVRLVRYINRNSLKALGNAVVPQITELIGRWIIQHFQGRARSRISGEGAASARALISDFKSHISKL